MMITRNQYMNGEVTHSDYYAQFVTDALFHAVARNFTVERLVRCSDQLWFNTIPLHLWDRLEPLCKCMVSKSMLLHAHETWSSATGVCILKEAARQVVSNYWVMQVA